MPDCSKEEAALKLACAVVDEAEAAVQAANAALAAAQEAKFAAQTALDECEAQK